MAEKKIQPKDPGSAKDKAETEKKESAERVNKRATRVVRKYTKRFVK